MSSFPVLLADEETDAVFKAWRLANPGTREAVLIFGAIGFVTVLALIWAIFLRKRRRRRRSHHHSHHQSSEQPAPVPAAVEEVPPLPPENPHGRRRRRHRKRSLNPTLAQTGGLPPIRQESPPEPRL
jgi:hypothetical protein